MLISYPNKKKQRDNSKNEEEVYGQGKNLYTFLGEVCKKHSLHLKAKQVRHKLNVALKNYNKNEQVESIRNQKLFYS